MSLKPYPVYKDSGIEWIGQIPAHWDLRPFFSIARQNRRSNKGFKENNLKSLSYGRIVSKDITAHDGLLPESFETYQIIERNDIVFRLTDLQNDKRSLRSAIVTERGIITSAYLSVRPIDIEPSFLAYAMRDADLRKVFYSMGGGLRQSMKYEDMKWLPVVFPPRSEQREIVKYLNHETAEIDEFIADQERLIELLEERRAATITHAVTQGLDPAAPRKDSGIEWVGDIPSEWELTRIKYLGTTHIGLTYSPEDIVEGPEQGRLVFRAGNIKNGNIDLSDSVYVGKEVPDSLLTQRGDILICARSGSSSLIGKNALIDSKNEGQTFGAFMTVLRSRNNEYLYWLLNSSLFKAQVGLFITATINQLTNATLNNFIVPLPPASVRSRIVDHLQAESKKIDAAISDAREAIALSRERRAALISAAVTGQIDVSQAQRPVDEVLEDEVRV